MKFIIEGIDRIGKSTLIKNLEHKLGYHQKIHCPKPELLDCYNENLNNPLEAYQRERYNAFFEFMHNDSCIIFDRGHLSEVVYSPIYRGYSANHLFDMEKENNLDFKNDLFLILLICSDTSFLVDDGKSLDFSKKDVEQKSFKQAFALSNIKNKLIIDVCNGNKNFRNSDEILNQVLDFVYKKGV